MQIKGKILTIAGIVLIFGYFISESFKDTTDPTQVVMIDPSLDPYNRQKFDQSNYSTIESPDGREIITGYSRPEEQVADDEDRYKSRHQQELEEPQMIYRE